MALNKAYLVGRTTNSITVNYTSKTKTAIAVFDLAIENGYGNRRRTSFVRCKAFSHIAENLSKYVAKGTKLIMECEPNTETWQGKDEKKHRDTFFYVLEWSFAESKAVNKSPEEPDMPTNNQPFLSPEFGNDLPFV